VLALGSAAAVAVGAWCMRGVFVHHATAQTAGVKVATSSAQPAVVNSAAAATSDYTSRVVAYIHASQAITRQDLGEYLIARFGAERLGTFLNRRILDKACAEHGISVTAAEVDAALGEDLKGAAMDQATFIKTVLARYKKSLFEWREDVLRPRLQMTRMVQERVTVTPEEQRKAFETAHGEKVECRIIFWPLSEEKQAISDYGKISESEAGFAEKAGKQARSDLRATGGKIRPIARHTMEKQVEEAVFRLRPGEVTTLLTTQQGIVMFKCDKRIPADVTVNFEAVKPKLTAEIKERKLQAEMAATFQALKQQARPQPLLQKSDRAKAGPTPPPNEVVAYLWGSTPVTREELGEYLIARMGAEKVEFLVNRRIIETECKAKNITASEEEIDRGVQDDLKMLNITKDRFEKEILASMNKNMYEWREDVIRPRIMLTKLCQGRVKYTEDELKQCFVAHYGERLECRAILWPPDPKSRNYAMSEWARIRDSEEEFARKAKTQASGTLASVGGKMPAFGRHAFGHEEVEQAAFALQPGEITPVIDTPQGPIVLKLDHRLPPDTRFTLDMKRQEMITEVFAKKLQLEMQVVFKELHTKAAPQMLLKSANTPVDLAAESKRLTADLPPLGGPVKK
jgi:parvulin-like peptidyl-prolyl isomerase